MVEKVVERTIRWYTELLQNGPFLSAKATPSAEPRSIGSYRSIYSCIKTKERAHYCKTILEHLMETTTKEVTPTNYEDRSYGVFDWNVTNEKDSLRFMPGEKESVPISNDK